MAKAIRIGGQMQLPSGRTVRITAKGAETRPWGAVFVGRSWHVVRECSAGDAPGRVQIYFGGEPAPLQLDEADAIALADALNRAR
jgi:hypothetical protein